MLMCQILIYDPVSKMYHLLEQEKSKEMLLT